MQQEFTPGNAKPFPSETGMLVFSSTFSLGVGEEVYVTKPKKSKVPTFSLSKDPNRERIL